MEDVATTRGKLSIKIHRPQSQGVGGGYTGEWASMAQNVGARICLTRCLYRCVAQRAGSMTDRKTEKKCKDVLGFPRLFDTFVVTTSAPRRGPPPLVEPRSVAEAEDLAREPEETVVGCRSAVPVIHVSDEDARVKSGCE
jgi:hypothetical protein